MKRTRTLQQQVATAMTLERMQLDAPENPTAMAEWAADLFRHDEWLDDESHWIWEEALEAFPELD